jgi:hypothetical protein
MEALDLTKRPPRSPREMLPGLDLLMMARTVDKLRASLPGGNLGSYKIAGFSERVLKGLGIDEGEMRDAVAAAPDDAAVAAWVAAHSDASRFAMANALISEPTVGGRLGDAEWLAKNPVAKTLAPETPLIDYLVVDDREHFAKT